MLLVKLQTAAEIDNYIPPVGYVVVFAQESGESVVIRCKNHNGDILTISGANGGSDDSVEIDEVNHTISIPSAQIYAGLPNTLELRDASVIGDSILIN